MKIQETHLLLKDLFKYKYLYKFIIKIFIPNPKKSFKYNTQIIFIRFNN